MTYQSLIEKVNFHFTKNLPFVIYSLPESDTVSVLLQKNSELYKTEDFLKESFVFAPFNYENKAYCIPYHFSDFYEQPYKNEIVLNKKIEIKTNQEAKAKHCQLIEKAIKIIESGKNSKIVVSRREKFQLKKLELVILISRILNLYKSAFRYVWFHPKTGLWCGASPELLLKTEGTSFETMALAGTQKYEEDISPRWSEKEIEEQQIVSDSIFSSLEQITSILKVSKTYNFKAASLVHLRTDFTGIFNKRKTTLLNLVSVLHPTPAVCGTPKKIAAQFITENENYEREYYTGFLGPICGKDNCSQLFVNLRCMKIENNLATLFVGGGITKDSVESEEWQETQNKLHTMLQVLQPML